ncbi:tryptophan halogenase family protein [Aliikangiella sp. G2MR2-5]|uniref:tryptophan halogenase family protein n=1 Tax=Aliikangiella sp. G2MR2-5 TaxID=2788943 RepID=UPI0018AC403C|nr:tryptophan halogenase family protein [Aliikangiella sp. G2MR2-5]
MSTNKIKSLVIAGGGSAGWMTAAMLSKLFSPAIKIILVESDAIGTVGVGEATIPAIKNFNRMLGIDEADFLKFTKGTFKLGIQFDNWGKVGDSYMHAFGRVGNSIAASSEFSDASFIDYWLKYKQKYDSSDFWDFSLNYLASKDNKFCDETSYAYHFDASLYAKYLRELSEKWGVERVEGKITNVKKDERGFIKQLNLESGKEVSGDFFIDCTGFRSLLIGETLGSEYEDWSHWLPADSAIAVQSSSTKQPIPYTRSTAHKVGWQWCIPLQHRVGNGIVYSSKFMDDDEARKTLVDNIDGDLLTEPRVIRFKTGMRVEPWKNNCLAIGLASGFLEPLESTSLHLIHTGIKRFVKLFPSKENFHKERTEYNSQTNNEYQRVRDVIILHYYLNQRDDSDFWIYCREMDIPESLKQKIETFTRTSRIEQKEGDMFSKRSWQQIMLGQGITPNGYHPIVDLMPESQLEKVFAQMREKIEMELENLPTHQEFIDSFCKADSY